MNVLSLFDGMSCGMIALGRANIKVNNYFASEIDKYAIAVSKDNYPNIIQIGDVTKVSFKDGILYTEYNQHNIGKIDLLIGGFPCQDFSFAGKGLNFDGDRGKLFFEVVRILKEVNPTYFLFENVKMKKEYEHYISNLIKVSPILINSSLVSAQNRQRLYWTNIKNITQPTDKNITWGDVREHSVESEKYYYTEAAMQWLGRHSNNNNKKLSIHTDSDKMQMIEASHGKKYSSQRFFGIIDTPSKYQAVGSMRGRYLVNGIRQDAKELTAGNTQQYIEFRYDGKSNALTTVSKDNVVVPFTHNNRVPASEFFFRYITPLECEKLQTLPDGYTSKVSDSQRYKMIGNGWTVDVISHIFRHINEDMSQYDNSLF